MKNYPSPILLNSPNRDEFKNLVSKGYGPEDRLIKTIQTIPHELLMCEFPYCKYAKNGFASSHGEGQTN